MSRNLVGDAELSIRSVANTQRSMAQLRDDEVKKETMLLNPASECIARRRLNPLEMRDAGSPRDDDPEEEEVDDEEDELDDDDDFDDDEDDDLDDGEEDDDDFDDLDDDEDDDEFDEEDDEEEDDDAND